MTNDFNPRERFQAGPFAKDHLAWSRSEVSRAAIEATLSQMAKNYKGAELMLMEGAIKFSEEILKLAEPQGLKLPTESRATLQAQLQPQQIRTRSFYLEQAYRATGATLTIRPIHFLQLL